MKTNKKMGAGKKVALIGAGIAVAAVAAYFLSGKKNQKAVKVWATKMKGEVTKKLEAAGEVSKETYENIIDAISEKYKKLDAKEVASVVGDLKKKWNEMNKGVQKTKAVKKVKSAVKKIVKKAVTKAVKKVSKKSK
jgi:hypothetical protein